MKHTISILTVAAMMAVGALPVLAQQPGPTPLTATGVLGQPFFEGQDPEPIYPLTDEATGTTYNLISGFVDLGASVGQRVTIEGVRVPGIDPLAFNVTSIQPAPPGGDTITAAFRLTVEGQPPANAAFFGLFGYEGGVPVRLADLDGDGVYTGSVTGPVSAFGGSNPQPVPVLIVQGTGTRNSINLGIYPGSPITIIKVFGLVAFDSDKTFSASASFGQAPPAGGGGSGSLPNTGGPPLVLSVLLIAAGVLPVAGGLLIRKLAR